ncbi:hypothetical protein FHT36_002301 [Xanthobacter sp. SG618]|uniref:DUF2059 domain-containing protein n=1 Tax=Xanthobacter sp. SG618 TaxID=2587121 RepID=UPI00145CB2B3|nr:DUF2059 domain-containing protein [Xanthobacter sp. SG618]NMN58399.1 hypothetical protein [Xanthobacter sp. SG618]
MKTFRAVLLVAALLIPAAAHADEASDKAALARQVVDFAVVPGLEKHFGRMIGQAAEKLPADKRDAARAALTTESASIREDLVGVFAGYYADSYSLSELKELAAFYGSPLGRKMVQVQENPPEAVNMAVQQQILKLVAFLSATTGGPR